jgi:hypothetical protein
MTHRLPVPPELEHLIEKRDRDTDRRQQTRRKAAGARSTNKTANQPERRLQADRRQKRRRKSDS